MKKPRQPTATSLAFVAKVEAYLKLWGEEISPKVGGGDARSTFRGTHEGWATLGPAK